MSESRDVSKTCFFICPIGEEGSEARKRSDQVLTHIVRPAAAQNGLDVMRADEGPPGMITHQILQRTVGDRVVVADLTNHNANVFYELGVRHSFGKPVVALIERGQGIPFDLHAMRTIAYKLDLDGVAEAKDAVARQIAEVLGPNSSGASPLSVVAKLENLARTTAAPTADLMQTMLDRLNQVERGIAGIGRVVYPDLKDVIPPHIVDRLGEILQRYAEEIELLKSVRHAGVTGIFKRREAALHAFTPAIDEEGKEIMVVGSSLKGLLQKEEYGELAERIRLKAERGLVRVRFLLTHPAVADFRARQENRSQTEIGLEIISSLEKLKGWPAGSCEVKLYLGTPTCFGIKTTRRMLINLYPYVSVSYDSPCLILEYSPSSGSERPAYFFDEFRSRHFGAWETDLAIPVIDYDHAIAHCRSALLRYASKVEEILSAGSAI